MSDGGSAERLDLPFLRLDEDVGAWFGRWEQRFGVSERSSTEGAARERLDFEQRLELLRSGFLDLSPEARAAQLEELRSSPLFDDHPWGQRLLWLHDALPRLRAAPKEHPTLEPFLGRLPELILGTGDLNHRLRREVRSRQVKSVPRGVCRSAVRRVTRDLPEVSGAAGVMLSTLPWGYRPRGGFLPLAWVLGLVLYVLAYVLMIFSIVGAVMLLRWAFLGP